VNLDAHAIFLLNADGLTVLRPLLVEAVLFAKRNSVAALIKKMIGCVQFWLIMPYLKQIFELSAEDERQKEVKRKFLFWYENKFL
jgi:hypothetical protein